MVRRSGFWFRVLGCLGVGVGKLTLSPVGVHPNGWGEGAIYSSQLIFFLTVIPSEVEESAFEISDTIIASFV